MKAIIIKKTGDSSVLQYQNFSLPKVKKSEVKIKITATTVNYIDVITRSGHLPPDMMPDLPFIPGVECVGIIEECGKEVKGLEIGDMVSFFGELGASTYADFLIADAKYVIPIPKTLSAEKSAVIPVNYTTAYHMLHNHAKLTKDSIIFVHAAAGGVGTAIIQLAKIIGVTIIGSVGSDEKKQYILNQGADFAINYKKENIEQKVDEFTKGKGVNLSLNPVAGKSMIDDLSFLAPFGQLIIYGFIAGLPEDNLQNALLAHFDKSLTVSYSNIYTLYTHNFDRLKDILTILYKYLENNQINPTVYKSLPLSKTQEAHELLESGKVTGKLVLVP